MIGLEAEFLLVNDKNELVYPREHGFDTDDFVILGEIRAKPGKTRQETIAHFIEKFYETQYLAKSKNLTMEMETGFRSVSPKFYSEILKKMDHKNVSRSQNIYPEINLLELSDANVVDGKILNHKISYGLHIHFSSQNVVSEKYQIDKTKYTPVRIPLSLENINANIDLFRQEIVDKESREVTSTANAITKPVIKHIVSELDKNILVKFKPEENLKYRNPGFYEIKQHGFEYRSLPFNQNVLDNIASIVDFGYNLLEDLSI